MVHADRVVLLPREKSVCAQNESCKFCRGPRLTGCMAPRQSTAEPRGGQDTPLVALGKLVKSEGKPLCPKPHFPQHKTLPRSFHQGLLADQLIPGLSRQAPITPISCAEAITALLS